jgi:murein DD-endopeptidase MepM/ murein hydrolase activator NlpD
MKARRHALQGRARVHVGQCAPGLRQPAGIYATDHADPRLSGHFRWLLSTCLAAVAGLSGILFVISTSGDMPASPQGRPSTRADGLGWAVAKADKLLIPTGAVATTFIIEDPIRRRQGGREIILEKRYLRLVGRLAPIGKAQAEAVPHLNPMALYALEQGGGDGSRQPLVSARVIELLDGTLPNEDGERLEPQEIAELVARVQAADIEGAAVQLVRSEAAVHLTSGELTAQALSHLAFDGRAANISTLDKSVFEAEAEADAPASDAQSSATSLYASLHHTVSRQGMADPAILRILRIHAFQTDFSQRVRAGDAFEFFFEEDRTAPGNLGELLATAVTSRGETHKFYRFRTADGMVEYYDRQGSTARNFLMRRPVSCGEARLTSGFGRRRHPMLLFERMHLGEDWACAPGTPIMAAGNGTIEAAGPKGELGKHVRILHANGYKTAYGHMSRFAPGIAPGAEVRQGQVIGYVGMSGLSSGAHVHYEVLVRAGADGRFAHVDPISIQVPREHQLAGKELADFRKERDRIDTLMRRNPISSRAVTAGM